MGKYGTRVGGCVIRRGGGSFGVNVPARRRYRRKRTNDTERSQNAIQPSINMQRVLCCLWVCIYCTRRNLVPHVYQYLSHTHFFSLHHLRKIPADYRRDTYGCIQFSAVLQKWPSICQAKDPWQYGRLWFVDNVMSTDQTDQKISICHRSQIWRGLVFDLSMKCVFRIICSCCFSQENARVYHHSLPEHRTERRQKPNHIGSTRASTTRRVDTPSVLYLGWQRKTPDTRVKPSRQQLRQRGGGRFARERFIRVPIYTCILHAKNCSVTSESVSLVWSGRWLRSKAVSVVPWRPKCERIAIATGGSSDELLLLIKTRRQVFSVPSFITPPALSTTIVMCAATCAVC